MRFASVGKRYELLLDAAIVQEGKFIFPDPGFLADTRLPVKQIIIAKALAVQQLKYHFTSFTAKMPIPGNDGSLATVFTAMVTA